MTAAMFTGTGRISRALVAGREVGERRGVRIAEQRRRVGLGAAPLRVERGVV